MRLKLQLFTVRLFDVFKKEKAAHKATSEDDSFEETETYLTYVGNLLRSLSSKCEVWFNNTMCYNANGFSHKPQKSNEFNSSAVSNNGILACNGYSFEEFSDAFPMHPFTNRANS